MTSLRDLALLAIALTSCWPAHAQKLDWQTAPKMVLERQYAGPLMDTIIQRLRDPVDGTICYVYLPISAAHGPRADNGYVQYGSNTVGTISCTTPVASQATGSVSPKR